MHITRLLLTPLLLPSFLISPALASMKRASPKASTAPRASINKKSVRATSARNEPGLLLSSIRVNEVMPLFALPEAGGTPGLKWNSRDQIGQSSLLMILVGSQLPRQKDALNLMRQSVVEASGGLRARGIETVFVLPAAISFPNLPQMTTASAPTTTLIDTRGTLRQSLGTPTDGSIAVLIDRAGFVRRAEPLSVEPLPHASDLDATGSSQSGGLQAFLDNAVDSTPLIEVGHPAPDFTLRDMNGHIQRLSDYRNRQNLLLTFFPKCFTGGCRSHLSSLRDDASQITATDTTILAVSVDPAAGPRGQLADLKLPFPLVPDVGRNLSILYDAANSPEQLAARISVLIDKQGIVRWIDRQIDVKTHGKDVLAKLHELQMDVP